MGASGSHAEFELAPAAHSTVMPCAQVFGSELRHQLVAGLAAEVDCACVQTDLLIVGVCSPKPSYSMGCWSCCAACKIGVNISLQFKLHVVDEMRSSNNYVPDRPCALDRFGQGCKSCMHFQAWHAVR